jgi:hypothetical protein
MYKDKEYQKKYREKHKVEIKKYYKKYCQEHKMEKREYDKEYNQKYNEIRKKEHKDYYQNNKQNYLKQCKEYYLKNKNKIIKRITKYNKIKYLNDLNYKIVTCLRNRLCEAIKNNSKSKSTMKLIGCNIEQLKKYLEKLFKVGMNWSNYGKWHIDHIRPCASFDFSKSEEQMKCFHYTNLQPLWAKENISKGDKNV